MYLVALGINHRTAPVDIRERLAFGKAGLEKAMLEMRELPVVKALVALATCNRMEIYAAVTDLNEGIAAIKSCLGQKAGLNVPETSRYLESWTCYEAVNHLFRVAAGLDSMVLGETEILGQVQDAYEFSRRLKTGNVVINTLFQEAIRVGKRVRTLTGIDQHPASVSYAAVALARQTFGDLYGCTVLIIGAGEMGELTLRYLVAQGVSTVLVSNRSFARAEALAAEYGGEAIRYDLLFSHLPRADIVISCTAATHHVVNAGDVRRMITGREGRPLFFIDIAVPRDIEPAVGQIPGVCLYNIDDLEAVVLDFMDERKKAALAAEEVIEGAVCEFLNWLSTLSVIPTIKALQQRGKEIKEKELRHCLNRLGKTDPRTEKLIRGLADSLVKKLLHTPVTRLKEYASLHEGHLYSKMLENLFALQPEGDVVSRECLDKNPEYRESKAAAQSGEGSG